MSTWRMSSFPIDDSSAFVRPGTCELSADGDRWHLKLPIEAASGAAELDVDLEPLATRASRLQGRTVVDAELSYSVFVELLSIDTGNTSRDVFTGFVVRTSGAIEEEDDTESFTAVEDNPPPDEDRDDED